MVPVAAPAAEHCVAPESVEGKHVTVIMTFAGAPAQVEAFLRERPFASAWQRLFDETRKGRRTVRYQISGEQPYRVIGGVIYSAQALSLNVDLQTKPQICGMETK